MHTTKFAPMRCRLRFPRSMPSRGTPQLRASQNHGQTIASTNTTVGAGMSERTFTRARSPLLPRPSSHRGLPKRPSTTTPPIAAPRCAATTRKSSGETRRASVAHRRAAPRIHRSQLHQSGTSRCATIRLRAMSPARNLTESYENEPMRR